MAQAQMSAEAFSDLFGELCTWGAWGTDDARGALNYIGPDQVRRAAGLVSSGRTVGLGLTLDTTAGPDNPRPVEHTMIDIPSEVPADGTAFACDSFSVACHGDRHSHIDALCHVAFRGSLYNGVPADSVTATGASTLGAENLRNGIVGRGVLLDIPSVRQVAWLDPGDVITVADLLAAEEAQGVRVGAGDVLLCRTGHHRRRGALGAWDAAELKTGLDPRAMTWVRDRQVAAMGCDGDSDTSPSVVEQVDCPVHVLAMCAMGIVLMDCLNLDDLAQACAEERRWEFLLTVAPLVLSHGTGTPVNPIAVF
ncbi:MAG TPA: cyclase family protein [Streptosporangiaceae bacterium]|nr:cyclase family protein [Streptosporangiaceae bacterium]